ncbi:MAG: hypothetical protein ABJP48_09845 [Erythrobacter sp.]
MIGRNAMPWQLILADLALILFLVSMAGLAGMKTPETDTPAPDRTPPKLAVAQAQSLYRPSANGPELDDWLASQELDPRQTLTIFVDYRAEDPTASWLAAQKLAEDAASQDVPVRVVLAANDGADIYASLAFDQPRF